MHSQLEKGPTLKVFSSKDDSDSVDRFFFFLRYMLQRLSLKVGSKIDMGVHPKGIVLCAFMVLPHPIDHLLHILFLLTEETLSKMA